MKVHPTLVCFFFFLSLQDGNIGLVNAQTIVYSGTKGDNVTIQCSFRPSSIRKFFCKEKCKQEDILIETTDVTTQKGRYRIENKRGDISVTIAQLTESDSGPYRCGWGTVLSSASYRLVEIIVTDALLDGDSSEEKILYSRTGGTIVIECSFTSSGSRKYFCKGDCKNEDILLETNNNGAQRDRHSIRYIEGFSSGGYLFVSITQLTESDSGRYRCGLDRRRNLYREFRINVTDVPSATTTTTTTTQSVSSNSGGLTPPHTESTTTRDVLLYVGLTLVFMVILSLSVLIVCRKRTSKAEEPHVETDYISVTETSRMYEDIREDRQSRSPVEISSEYTHIIYRKPNGAETNNDYSVFTAAHSQNTAEDNSSKLTYSEVFFSNRPVGSSNSALRGDGDNVVYSVPRVQASSDAEDDLAVYSAVN